MKFMILFSSFKSSHTHAAAYVERESKMNIDEKVKIYENLDRVHRWE